MGFESSLRQFTVINLTAKSLVLNISIPRQFVLVGAPCATLAANASCSFSVAFLPLTNGNILGSLYAQATPSDGSATLSGIAYAEGYGTGYEALTVTGALIVNNVFSFGQVTSGQTLAQTFTLANLADDDSLPITVRRITSNPPFLSTSTCGIPLHAGQNCTVNVTYAPSNQVATGTSSPAIHADAGSLIIEGDAASGPSIVNLSGQAAPIAVANPSNSAPLATFTLSQSSLTFATTTVGNVSAPQSVTLTNTGSITIHIASLFSSADFTITSSGCAVVVPGATCSITVTATPQSAGVHSASLEIASDSATSLEFISLIVSAAPSALSTSPSALNFGTLLIGGSATLPVHVTNTSTTPITFNAITTTGDYVSGGSCPSAGGALAAGASCTVQVTFTALTSGTLAGTLSLATSASTNPLMVALTGIGAQSELLITPSSLAFGNIAVGSSSSLSLTLLNNGPMPIINLALTLSGDYAVTSPCPVTTLAAGASCAVQITFTPSANGSRTGTLTVISSDPGSPASIPLTGTSGLPGGGFTLTVNGGVSASATVTSGQPATYQLAISPTLGFSGSVALTCTPVTAGQYAACSLLPSTVTLGGASQSSVATINTITSATADIPNRPGSFVQTAFLSLLLPVFLMLWRGWRPRQHVLLAVLLVSLLLISGCGSPAPATSSRTLYTPAGVYQYQVTASSTSGTPTTQSVILNLTVGAR